MTTVSIYNVAIELWGALFSIIVGLCSLLPGTDKMVSRRFANLVFCDAALLVCDSFAYIFRGDVSKTGFVMVRVTNEAVFFFNFIMLMCFINFLKTYLDEFATSTKVLECIGFFIFVFGSTLIVLNNFIEIVYTFDESNRYVRCKYNWLVFAIGFVGLLAIMVVLLIQRKRLSRSELVAFLAYTVLPLLGVSLQARFYGCSIMNISYTVAILFVFFALSSEKSRLIIEKERQLNELKISMLMDYIQPEILLKSIDSISVLTDKHPNSGRAAMGLLKEYLEENVQSVNRSVKYSVQESIEHMEKYLSMVLCNNDIQVNLIYEIRYDNFTVELNTVQLLVAQALDYGLTKSLDSCSLKVVTDQDKEGNFIQVIYIPDVEVEPQKSFLTRI